MDKKEPIIEFENIQQAQECLKYWQNILFLNDWHIKINLIPSDDCVVDDLPCAGRIDKMHVQKIAVIDIALLDDDIPDDDIVKSFKICQEKVLVHEILHIVIDLGGVCNHTVEGSEFLTTNHQRVESIAKSLIMAKYGVDFDWFKNF